ncbi:CLUMA_CG003333, isoform A [Clunio marinus]|uniref:CLUMA_CG003333, isoform A n=1 Tax=Clunio marinus TaxID=568069 RepID=A0A1J1HPS4_9DIPT|nr:CLUMA_CG003333, isoform A [Clunio marinus]
MKLVEVEDKERNYFSVKDKPTKNYFLCIVRKAGTEVLTNNLLVEYARQRQPSHSKIASSLLSDKVYSFPFNMRNGSKRKAFPYEEDLSLRRRKFNLAIKHKECSEVNYGKESLLFGKKSACEKFS